MGRAWREARRFRPSFKRRAAVRQRAEHRGLLSAQRALRRASPLSGSATKHERPCWDLRGRGRDLGRRAGGISVEPARLARRATSRRRSPCQPADAVGRPAPWAFWQVPSNAGSARARGGMRRGSGVSGICQGAGTSHDVDMRRVTHSARVPFGASVEMCVAFNRTEPPPTGRHMGLSHRAHVHCRSRIVRYRGHLPFQITSPSPGDRTSYERSS